MEGDVAAASKPAAWTFHGKRNVRQIFPVWLCLDALDHARQLRLCRRDAFLCPPNLWDWGSSYFPRGKRLSKNSDADMPEFLIASLRVVVRQASRDLRHRSVALLVKDHLMQRSCARSHCGMKTPSTSARAGGRKAIKGRRRINRIRHNNMHEW